MTMILETTSNMITLEDPTTMRFVLAPSGIKGDTSASIHLLHFQDPPEEGHGGDLAHVFRIWSGPRDIAPDLCSRLAFALAHPFPGVLDVAELEAMCITTRDRLKRDLDAPSTEDDTTP